MWCWRRGESRGGRSGGGRADRAEKEAAEANRGGGGGGSGGSGSGWWWRFRRQCSQRLSCSQRQRRRRYRCGSVCVGGSVRKRSGGGWRGRFGGGDGGGEQPKRVCRRVRAGKASRAGADGANFLQARTGQVAPGVRAGAEEGRREEVQPHREKSVRGRERTNDCCGCCGRRSIDCTQNPIAYSCSRQAGDGERVVAVVSGQVERTEWK
mmetsp:Transcript_7421/g.13936  ORF Transcript_7421/g.13936 Transcript_7421/m.13936 type:complete len:209 (-) Transcript_7421:268-894(-)